MGEVNMDQIDRGTLPSMRIALSGKMCSGKSVVAERLCKKYDFIELAFAARLKVIASEMFGCDVSRKDERGRTLLQQFAQRMREIDPMVWLHYVIREIPATGNVVVSDVRYPNEFWTLRDLGFTMVRMIQGRREQERLLKLTYPDMPLALLDDRSETALDDGAAYRYNAFIYNNASNSLASVLEQTDSLYHKLRGDRW